MTHFKIYNTVLGLCALLCLSCSEEIELTDPSAATQAEAFHTCRLYLDGDQPSFEGEASTRAANGAWADGDVLYLHFAEGVYGQAVYAAQDDSWTVSYKGNIASDLDINAQVFFSPGAREQNGKVTLTENTAIYTDATATYTYSPSKDAIYLKARLSSPCWRMRFKGDAGSYVTIESNDNLSYYSQLDLSQGTLSQSHKSANLITQSDRYTDYVYVLPCSADFTLSLTTNDGNYTRNFQSEHARAGQSGVLSIPTSSAHDGWTFNKVDKVAKLVDGPTFNERIITLANGRKLEFTEEDNWGNDQKIKSIVFEYQSDKTSATLVSTDDSPYPIYASFEDGIITISTPAQKIELISTHGMFYKCSALTSLGLSNFDTRNVTDMSWMFSGCSALTSLNISNFDTKNATNMYQMFSGCSALTSLDLSNFDTRNVTDMGFLFSGCSALTSLDLSNFNTRNVTNMYALFQECHVLTSLILSNFDTRSVTDMSCMFSWCYALTSLDLSNFDTRSVTDMSDMFSGCSALASLDLSNFDTKNMTNMSWMFGYCTKLESLSLGYNFVINSGIEIGGMCSYMSQDVNNCTISCIASTKNRMSESVTELDTSKITWNLLDHNSNENDVNGSEFDDFEQW